MRVADQNGSLGNRVVALASMATGSKELLEIRNAWETMLNDALDGAGIQARVSSQSLAQQKLDALLLS